MLSCMRKEIRFPEESKETEMSTLNGYDNGANLNNVAPIDNGGISRPMETYDGLIRFIERFPLRLVICFVGLSLLLTLAGWRDTLSGDAMMKATLAYIVGFFVVLGEAVFGKLTRLIKDLLIKAVIIAEENSAQL